MYRLNTQVERQVGRRADRTIARFRGPRMHRNTIRTAVGAAAAAIAISRLSPRLHPLADSNAIDQRTRHGFTESDAERREGSP